MDEKIMVRINEFVEMGKSYDEAVEAAVNERELKYGKAKQERIWMSKPNYGINAPNSCLNTYGV